MGLYINKWWGNFVGGCDDSLLLLDYFGQYAQSDFTLGAVLSDLHLDSLLRKNKVKNGDAYFRKNESCELHFDMAIDVVIDLSAILLESMHTGVVDIQELDPGSQYTKRFSISASAEDVKLLLEGLSGFIADPGEYDLAMFMDESDLKHLVEDCKEIGAGIAENVG